VNRFRAAAFSGLVQHGYRVDTHGFARRKPASRQSNGEQQGSGGRKRRRIAGVDAEQETRKEFAYGEASGETHCYPHAASPRARAVIIRKIAPGCAPSAMRIATAPRLLATRYDSTPYNPTAASSRARTANPAKRLRLETLARDGPAEHFLLGSNFTAASRSAARMR
jgi:hypothetical protein